VNFREAWTKLNDETVGTPAFWFLAIQNLIQYRQMGPIVAAHASGRVLDVGAGKLAWRPLLQQHCRPYQSADVVRQHPELDYLFDLTKPVPLATASFDTIFCNSVLEHVQDPGAGLSEIHRIVRPGGKVILSVPFLFYLHGEPDDYFRFTPAGIQLLCRRAGFDVVACSSVGGYFSNLLNAPSVMTSTLLGAVGLRRTVAWLTRFWTYVACLLDRIFDPRQLFAFNTIVVLRKPEAV
jgi:SAM-dependent methyltransferase